MNLRKNKTMTREEIEEELGNMMKGQGKKLDDQTAMIKQQNETIDVLRKDQMAMMKQHEDQMAMMKQHTDQMASAKEQTKTIENLSAAFVMAMNLLEKK
jgi:CBS-domain-containing membrane protein